MRTAEIKEMIRTSVADESATHRLAGLLQSSARQRGVEPSAQEVAGAVQFVREYIECVPILLEQVEATAVDLQLRSEVDQLLKQLEAYWFEAGDVVPDHLGLVGLADDAYATLLTFQALSDFCRVSFGRPLLEHDLTSANVAMRHIIGGPSASALETRVEVTLREALAPARLERMVGSNLTVCLDMKASLDVSGVQRGPGGGGW